MAAKKPEEQEQDKEDEEEEECAVCLQTCVHPVRLQCGHIFCYLCVKGASIQRQRCPMCRAEIAPGYLVNPVLVSQVNPQTPSTNPIPNATTAAGGVKRDDASRGVKRDDASKGVVSVSASASESFRWFYEGRNGWWEYDQRTASDLEEAFLKAARVNDDDDASGGVTGGDASSSCELLIAGSLYTIDFEHMLQYRRNEPSRRRRMRRDLAANVENRKGVAGLRILCGVDNPTSATSATSATSGGGDDDEQGSSTLQLSQQLSNVSF